MYSHCYSIPVETPNGKKEKQVVGPLWLDSVGQRSHNCIAGSHVASPCGSAILFVFTRVLNPGLALDHSLLSIGAV